jgi:hypothetical protein
MSTEKPEPIASRVDRFINSRAGRGLTLDCICENVRDTTTTQVKNALKYLVKQGRVMNTGTTLNPLYLTLAPNGSVGVKGSIGPALKGGTSKPKPAAVVHMPEGVKVKMLRGADLHRGTWTGTNWAASTMRPGCLDHEAIPSRRGDALVPHGTAMPVRSSRHSA